MPNPNAPYYQNQAYIYEVIRKYQAGEISWDVAYDALSRLAGLDEADVISSLGPKPGGAVNVGGAYIPASAFGADSAPAAAATPSGQTVYTYGTELLGEAFPYYQLEQMLPIYQQEAASPAEVAGIRTAADKYIAELNAKAAMERLLQEQALTAARLAGSGRLRDTISAMMWGRGQGQQPGVYSAVNRLADTLGLQPFGAASTAVGQGTGTAGASGAAPAGTPGLPSEASWQQVMETGIPALQRRITAAAPFAKVQGLAQATPGAGVGYVVGERGPEVLRLKPFGGVEVIPIAGGMQYGGSMPGVAETPAYKALQAGTRLPAFQPAGGPAAFPEIGLGPTKEPESGAKTYWSLNPDERMALLDIWAALGFGSPQNILYEIQQATPGYRQYRAPVFGLR